jgi:peptidoglycan biosynthesis protein MviN/MurJ (putative lipid II flippase)
MLALRLKRDAIIEGFEALGPPLLRILLACCAMSLVILLASPEIGSWSDWQWFDRVYQLALLIVSSILCYVLMLWLMGFRRDHFIV